MRDIFYPFTITNVNTANDFFWDDKFTFAGESHEYWEIVCVHSGAVEAVEDEKVYTLRAGDMVCHAPMEFHRIKSCTGTSPHVTVMTFKNTGELPARLGDGVFKLSEDELRIYHSAFMMAYRFLHGEGSEADGAVAGMQIAGFLLHLSETHVPGNLPPTSKRAVDYQRVVDVMQNAVCENLTLPEIAARAAVSLSTMKLLFVDFSGQSPKQYYAGLRIKEARRLLEGGTSVTDVSITLGFSSPNYFSLFFKRNTGSLPKTAKR